MSEAGTLIAIGGHEDRDGERVILRAVAEAMCAGPMLILAAASRHPHRYFSRYRDAFGGIGVHDVRYLPVREPADARDRQVVDAVGSAGGVFLTGGSQKRLVETILDSPLHAALRDLVDRCGVIAGTSAGASALGETMLSGTRDPILSRGLAFVPGVMFDQHFSQRDRIGRLTSGLTRARLHTGIGIDEDTALVLCGEDASVIGSGVVTVLESAHPARRLGLGSRFRLGDTIAA
jgi:cyanophycinase